MTLAEFLLARIEDDEMLTRQALNDWMWEDDTGLFHDDERWTVDDGPGYVVSSHGRFPVAGPPPDRMWLTGGHIARWDPARVLAECEAKQRIVNLFRETSEGDDSIPEDADFLGLIDEIATGRWEALRSVVRLIALPYADHPQFQEEWKP